MSENAFPGSPIPLTIIGGYLGAGKTTLLNHILRGNHGLRIAVLINDFGNINIDAQLIEQSDCETMHLSNGCICCSLVNGFVLTLLQLTERSPLPEHIIIEASGVSDPAKIAQFGISNPWFRLDGIIVVADAEMVRYWAADNYMSDTVMQQLKAADIIVLNKVDLVEEQQCIEVKEWILSCISGMRIIEAVQSQVPFELLIGDGIERISEIEQASLHMHAREFNSWSFVRDQPFHAEAFRAIIDTLPESIIRGKGILWLVSDTSRKAIFQMVGKRWTLDWGDKWSDEKPQNQLVLISMSGPTDTEQFTQLFTTALATSVPPLLK